jgi:hypothetical protein
MRRSDLAGHIPSMLSFHKTEHYSMAALLFRRVIDSYTSLEVAPTSGRRTSCSEDAGPDSVEPEVWNRAGSERRTETASIKALWSLPVLGAHDPTPARPQAVVAPTRHRAKSHTRPAAGPGRIRFG